MSRLALLVAWTAVALTLLTLLLFAAVPRWRVTGLDLAGSADCEPRPGGWQHSAKSGAVACEDEALVLRTDSPAGRAHAMRAVRVPPGTTHLELSATMSFRARDPDWSPQSAHVTFVQRAGGTTRWEVPHPDLYAPGDGTEVERRVVGRIDEGSDSVLVVGGLTRAAGELLLRGPRLRAAAEWVPFRVARLALSAAWILLALIVAAAWLAAPGPLLARVAAAALGGAILLGALGPGALQRPLDDAVDRAIATARESASAWWQRWSENRRDDADARQSGAGAPPVSREDVPAAQGRPASDAAASQDEPRDSGAARVPAPDATDSSPASLPEQRAAGPGHVARAPAAEGPAEDRGARDTRPRAADRPEDDANGTGAALPLLDVPFDVLAVKKTGHFLSFALLAILVLAARPRANWSAAIMLLVGFGLVVEIGQMFAVDRGVRAVDGLLNAGGVVCGGLLWLPLHRRRKRGASSPPAAPAPGSEP